MSSQPGIPSRLPSLPQLGAAAYHGIAGEIVTDIAPHTEADPAAVLVSLLAVSGAMIGDGPHALIGGSRHPARIWPLIIGRTASGRKGESWAQTEEVALAADDDFAANRVTSGLSTGEGLIACFADDKDADGNARSAPDKRLLVIEPEFARVLAASKRENNTLSPVLRALWDSGRAGVITRGQPIHCRGAHLVIIAHVTPRELLAKVAAEDVSGGLLNRFLPVLVQRPHLLPNPGQVDVMAIGVELGNRTVKARAAGRQLRRGEAAEALWAAAYRAIAEDEADGALGEILARGPSYAMRLALTYALLDGAREISEAHLRAGLTVWAYAAASARRVFADTDHKSDIERLADFLADSSGPRTRTEIRDLFKRNKSTRQIDAMLEELGGNVQEEEDRSGTGRPVTLVYWTGLKQDALGAFLAGEPGSGRPYDETTFAGQAPPDFGRTTKPLPEEPQASGDKSSSRNVVALPEPSSGDATTPTCTICGEPHERHGPNGRPCRAPSIRKAQR